MVLPPQHPLSLCYHHFPKHLTISPSQRLYYLLALSQTKNRLLMFLSELKNLGDPRQRNTTEMLQAPMFFCSVHSTM